jgi:hypothetical protein
MESHSSKITGVTSRRTKHNSRRRRSGSTTISSAGRNRNPGVREPRFPLASTLINKTFKVVQTCPQLTTFTSSVAGPSFSFISFYFGLLDNVAAWASVFDQYRILKLQVSFRPRMNFESSSTANTGTFITVVDVDDSTALTTIAAAMDYATAVVGRGIEEQTRTFVPHLALAAYSGAFTSYANVEPTWIDCASTGVLHYGVKTAWSQTDAAYIIDSTTRVYLEFRNIR